MPIGTRNSSRNSSPGVTGLSRPAVPLVVVDDLDILCSCVRPAKAQAKLVVHSDAVLTGPISLERFEPVAGRHSKVFKRSRDLQLAQLTAGDGFNADELSDSSPAGEGFGVCRFERNNHNDNAARY
jgi:hypothetical protein